MENYTDNPVASPASLVFVGLGWFPQSPGGVERYVYDLTRHLTEGGDRVELCGVGLPETQSDSPVQLTNLAAPDSPIVQRLRSTRRSFLNRKIQQPDAINLHFALYSFPLMNALPNDVPVTFTFHGPWALESQQEAAGKLSVLIKKWVVEKQVYRRCDRFIVLSKAFGTILHQDYQVPWSKIQIIRGGVDLTRFQPNLSRQEARTQLNWPQDRAILFTPRRLVHRMGIDKLLGVLSEVKTKIPDVWLAIAGKGPLKAALEQQATELGLDNHVKFLGFLPDEQLPIAYQAADLMVMPSQSLEGFGLAIVESLACGTPALCTPVGGMPEVLEPLSSELITASSDAKDIAQRLEEVLTGKVSMPSRSACREYTVSNFDWHNISQQVRQVLLKK